MTIYQPDPSRYERVPYARSGHSGLMIPRLSLGLWHNFGGVDPLENQRALLRRAFDLGITHFDLANNYGPPPGSAEENCGRLLREDFSNHRDELIISTKAGYFMWPGPYGEWGSRKSLLSSLDQSLRRLRLEYVDIFYHHRPDPDTPLEESMGALSHAVKSGKALYVGLSNYKPAEAEKAISLLRAMGTPCLIHQPRYSMFARGPEAGLLDLLHREGVGCIVFSPLAQGLLTNRYLSGIPTDSRAGRSDYKFLQPDALTPEVLARIRALDGVARERGQTLAQLALAWVLRKPAVTSVLIGASKTAQLDDNFGALANLKFSTEELARIEQILTGGPA